MRAVLVVMLVAGVAHAEDRAKAEQYFRAGAQAFKNQSFAAAAEQFELAYREMPLPEIAFSTAQAYRRQYLIEPKPEYVKRAVELYRLYLSRVKKGGRTGDASDGLYEMERELDRLTAQGTRIGELVARPATRLAVSVGIAGENRAAPNDLSVLPATDTSGVHATLDGKPVELFVPVDVTPEVHVVKVTAAGYFPLQVERRVVEGATELVEVELKPEPAHLAIETEGGAQIAIDGRPSAPVSEVVAGKHVVVVTRRGREPVVRELELGRGETKKLEVSLGYTGKRRMLPWLVGGAGAFAVLSGLSVLGALSEDGKMSSLASTYRTSGFTVDQLAEYRSDAQRRDDLRSSSYVLGGVAVAVGLAAAAVYYLDNPQPSERAIVPIATPTSAGVGVVGRF